MLQDLKYRLIFYTSSHYWWNFIVTLAVYGKIWWGQQLKMTPGWLFERFIWATFILLHFFMVFLQLVLMAMLLVKLHVVVGLLGVLHCFLVWHRHNALPSFCFTPIAFRCMPVMKCIYVLDEHVCHVQIKRIQPIHIWLNCLPLLYGSRFHSLACVLKCRSMRLFWHA